MKGSTDQKDDEGQAPTSFNRASRSGIPDWPVALVVACLKVAGPAEDDGGPERDTARHTATPMIRSRRGVGMPANAQPAEPTGAVRLIFEDDDDVRPLHQLPIAVLVTGFDAPPDNRPGHFAEIRDADDRALARVAIRQDASNREVFPKKPAVPITRMDIEHPGGDFTVVVPPRQRSVSSLCRI